MPRDTMSGLSQNLEEHVTCSICMDIYTDPLALACLHSYCRQCLHGIVSSSLLLRCPECRKEYKLGKKGLDNLKKNFQLASIVASYKEQTEKEAEQQRHVVKSSLTVCTVHPRIPCELACIPCKRPVCVFCVVENHNGHTLRVLLDQSEGTRRQSTTDISDMNKFDICSPHGKPFKLFCEVCQQLLCVHCLGSQHRGHLLANITDAYRNKLSEVEAVFKHLSNRQSFLKREQRSYRDAAQTAQTEAQRQHQEVTMHFRSLREALDKREEALHVELRSREQRTVSGNVIKSEHVQKQEEHAAPVLEDIQRLLTEDRISFLQTCQPRVNNVEQLLSEVTPGGQLPEPTEMDSPKISGVAGIEKLINGIYLVCEPDNPRITDPRITDPRITDPRITDPVPKPRKRQTFFKASNTSIHVHPSAPELRATQPATQPATHQVRVLQVGCQIQRGKAWKDGTRDGGPGHFGVVMGTTLDQHMYMVRWPNGNTGSYVFNPPVNEEIMPL